MDRLACRRLLATLLHRELDDTRRLLHCLDDEQKALSRNDIAAIEHLCRDKQQQLARIEQASRERIAIAQTAGFAPDGDGMTALVHWCDSDGGLADHWSQLLEQARLCREQNLVNGALIEASRRRVHTALGILRGSHDDGKLYNQHGGSDSHLGLRSLAKA